MQARAGGEHTRSAETTLKVAYPGSDYSSLDPAPDQYRRHLAGPLLDVSEAGQLAGCRGSDRGGLVPDAATTMPVVSDHGSTYTFTIRAGQAVQLGRSGNRRQLQGGLRSRRRPGHVVDRDVLHDRRRRRRCRARTRGRRGSPASVGGRHEADDPSQAKPDPTLLERLAMPYFCAIPDRLAHDPHGVDIACQRRAVLRRQSHDRPDRSSSTEEPLLSRPAAATDRQDRDHDRQGPGDDVSPSALRRVRIDLAGPPSADCAKLAKEFGVNKGRFFVDPYALALGLPRAEHGRPALSNVNLRKAINYAIDRPALVQLLGRRFGSADGATAPAGALRRTTAKRLSRSPHPDIAKAKSLLPGGKCGRLVLWVRDRHSLQRSRPGHPIGTLEDRMQDRHRDAVVATSSAPAARQPRERFRHLRRCLDRRLP